MTPYTPSLWSQAPASATHWGISSDGLSKWFVQVGDGLNIAHPSGGRGNHDYSNQVTDLHERPAAYKTPEQLIAEYRKEHGEEIEADAQTFFDSLTEDAQSSKNVLQIDHLLYDAAFHLALFEKYLAAERARIEQAQEVDDESDRPFDWSEDRV